MAFEITSGRIHKAKKIVVYGPEGIGKSSFAALFPDPLFIDTEGSTNGMDVKRFPRPTSWSMLGEELMQIISSKPCGTLVIDTIDWAENLCIEHICAKAGKCGIEDFGYGNGYVYEKEEFAKLLNRLEEVIDVGINVVLTAHAQLRKFSQPDEIGEYDRWELKLGKKTGSVISPLVKEWADLLLFANYKTMAVAVDKDGKKFKAQGNARVMYTEHHPCWDAKNRFGLPAELTFDYAHIAHLFEEAPSISTAVPAQPIEEKPTNAESSEPVMKYWCHQYTAEVEASPDSPGADYLEMPYESYLAVKKAHEEIAAEYKEPEKIQVPSQTQPVNPDTDEYDGIPKELVPLLKNAGSTEAEIRKAVSLKGYYPEDTPIANYDDGFVNGVLLGAWDKIKAFILDKREMYK